jgi:hypothetical protein
MTRFTLLLTLAFLGSHAPLRADDANDPLRIVPKQAVFALVIDHPRVFAESTYKLDAVQHAMELPALQDYLQNTAVRRFLQLVKFLERETGSAWPELLDKVAGGGAVFAAAPGYDAALLVLQGRDAAASEKVFELFIRIAEEEQARQGNTEAVKRTRQNNADVVQLNKETILARREAVILIANKSQAITLALDNLSATNTADSVLSKSSVKAAKTLLPKNPLAWFWIDFATVKESKQSKDFFENTRKDIFQTLIFGTTADCLRRSDFVAGGVFADKDNLRLAIRLPAGRDEFPPEFALHAPPAGTPGSLPLLEPPGVLYSQSFYLDPATFWKERDKLLNDAVRKQFEKSEKDLSKVVPGVKFGELLSLWGAYHRFVFVNTDTPPYKTEPGLKLPSFAYVTTMREPQFGKSVEGLLRGAGFLLSLSQGLKLVEETSDGVKLFGYRFAENKPYPGDDSNLRYNFEPTFAIVGNQFLAASTKELAKKMIVELRRTEKVAGSAELWRAKSYAIGVADALALTPDATVSDVILRQAISLTEARKQVDQLAAYLRTLGTVGIELDESAKQYSLDVVWRYSRHGDKEKGR